MAKEIPGWELCGPPRALIGTGAQYVHGEWYIPKVGCNSLQKLVDEWLESLWRAYYHCTFTGKGGRRFGYVSDGDHAISVLGQWGLLDEDGQRIDG